MRSWWLVAALVVLLVACASDGDPIALPSPPSVPTESDTVSTGAVTTGDEPPITGPPPTTLATTAPVTAVDDRAAVGFAVAEQLAAALADGDWATARRLSPEPPFSDEIYEQSFVGLERSTLFLTYSKVIDDAVDLWVAQVDQEERMSGPQTTLRCGHWRFDPSTSTLARVADRAVETVEGFVEPGRLEPEGRRSCTAFDLVPGSGPDDSEPSDGTGPIGVDDGWVDLRHEGRSYICRGSGVGNDLDCMLDDGGDRPATIIGSPDLWCTERGGGRIDCTGDGYHPSELDDFEQREAQGERVLCRGVECWIWPQFEQPSDATAGRSDFVCDARECVPVT